MLIDHLSVSRYGTFSLCPQSYKYKYHLKIAGQEPQPFYFVYGGIVHKISQDFVEGKGKIPLNKIANSVLNGDILLEERDGTKIKAPKLPAEYKKRLPEHLRSVQYITEKLGFNGFLEWEFEYDLDPPNKKFIVGFIDRLIPMKDDGYYILDYKTTKEGPYRKNNISVKSDIQLAAYALIVQKTFGTAANKILASLHYLEGNDLITTSFSQKTIDDTHTELLKIYNQIQQSNPETVWGKVGPHCARCDYKNICPFYKNKQLDINKLPNHLQGI